jgi:hypothetical protein
MSYQNLPIRLLPCWAMLKWEVEYNVCIEWDSMPFTVKHNLIVNKKVETFSILDEELAKFNGRFHMEHLLFESEASYTLFLLRWS